MVGALQQRAAWLEEPSPVTAQVVPSLLEPTLGEFLRKLDSKPEKMEQLEKGRSAP